jgi:hypothetical protein
VYIETIESLYPEMITAVKLLKGAELEVGAEVCMSKLSNPFLFE